jgi:hypothetical protein
MNEKPRYAIPVGPYLGKSALLKMGYLDASSCLAMTSMTIAELWSREKASLRRGCPFRQKDLDPYFTVEEIEEARRSLAKRLQGWARAEKRAEYDEARAARRAEYDKARGKRVSGRRLNDRLQGGMIVGVDSEGVKVGEPFILERGRPKTVLREDVRNWIDPGKSVYFRQRTCLWMAGGVEGFEDAILYSPDGLRSERIFEFLCSLPRKFSCSDPRAKQPIFVGFGFGYDIAQILADLPKQELWEVRKGKPWVKRNDPTWRANYEGWVLWRGYAVAVLPGKKIKICKLRDPNRPFKWRLDKNGETRRTVDWIERIIIYDAFGFFQTSLVNAIKKMPDVVSKEELAIIKAGKDERGWIELKDLGPEKFEELKRYTGLELKALTRMMEKTRQALHDADPERPIKLRHLYGAGAAAQALLLSRLSGEARSILGKIETGGEEYGRSAALTEAAVAETIEETVDRVLGEITPVSEENELYNKAIIWAIHAFHGGRNELIKQGRTRKTLYSNDISSAYPAQIAELPSMKGGRWVYCKNPTREQIEQSNMLSMFRVATRGFRLDLPFYPRPYRNSDGSVMYPPFVNGICMRDEVLGTFQWRDTFARERRDADYAFFPEGGVIEVSEALFFEPADPNERPFAWVRELFDYRAELLKVDPNDVRAIVIKLMLNSIYGKLAQGVGSPSSPPRFASPWMAAAITAGTRRKLLQAALTAPDAIVSFATDGIVSEKPLKIPTSAPGVKELGKWEHTKIVKDGGVFVQSGFYLLCEGAAKGEDGLTPKTRGFNPARAGDEKLPWKERLARIMLEDIPACWREGRPVYEFDYWQYIGLGTAVQSPATEAVIGCWKLSRRSQKLDVISRKRIVPAGARLRRSRAERLIALDVNDWSEDLIAGKLSAPHKPEWMNVDAENELERSEETENAIAGLA